MLVKVFTTKDFRRIQEFATENWLRDCANAVASAIHVVSINDAVPPADRVALFEEFIMALVSRLSERVHPLTYVIG